MSKHCYCPIGQNHLIRTLPEPARAALEPHLRAVDLSHGMILNRYAEKPRHVYFPTSGVGSTIVWGHGDQRIEVGLFGNDGMSATSVVMGADRSPAETFIQIPGSGRAIETDRFVALLAEVPALQKHLLLYVQTLIVQTSQTALSNGHGKLQERLARWLLMCHDRVVGDMMDLTHEFLSVMLGVRRPGVTVGTHLLEGMGLIRAERGRITILDRAGLERETHGTYGVPETEYMRLLGKPALGS